MSGCYRCGSDDGDDGKLCPACTMARMEERKQEKRELFRPHEARQASRRSGEDRSLRVGGRRSLGRSLVFAVVALLILSLVGGVLGGAIDLNRVWKVKPAALSMENILEMCKANPPEVHSAPGGRPCQYIERVCLKSPEASRCGELKEEIRMWILVKGQATPPSPE